MTRYELLDRIGVGGMAEIFRGKAVAAGGFEKPVAIKRILPHLSQDRRFVELLIAEAKVLSLLKHRNIVQIFDVGLGDDGQYFLVMEYVDGKDIGAVQRALEVTRRRIPIDLCLHIGAEICEALEHAHTSRGPDGKPMALVHRDVSPSNVLLSRAGEIKLTDFGIAKRAESDATQGGVVRGKFAYISPEQARNEPLDPRSDVFSVGILIWELICNRRLFSGLDDLAALRSVRDPVIPRPTDIDRSLPPELDQILLGALAKDKSRRIATCGQLGQKLRSLRYSLEVTVGDPATELAKIIDSTEAVERESKQSLAVESARPSSGPFDLDGGESTVIRIRTADDFSARDDNSISKARKAIGHFEEEQTRQATLTGEQLRMLRRDNDRESVEITAPKPTFDRARAAAGGDPSDDELTRTHDPLDDDAATVLGGYEAALDTPPHQHLTPSDDTRLVAPRDRRTPQPLPGVARPATKRAPTVPPPIPAAASPKTLQLTPAPVPVARAQTPHVAQPIRTSQSQPLPPQRAQSQPQPPHYAPAQPVPPQHGSSPAQPLPPHGGQPPYVPQTPFAQPDQVGYGAPQTPLPFAPPQQGAPYYPPQQAGNFPGWGPPVASQHPPREATPTAPDRFDGPVYPQHRGSHPDVVGFQREPKPGLQPWVLVVGAVIMATIAFLVTRAAIG